jgi:hypothetical protein
MSEETVTVLLNLSLVDYQTLNVLAQGPAFGPKATAEDVVAHLVASALDGARRPGSWERGWIQQAGLLLGLLVALLLGCGGVDTDPRSAAATSSSSSSSGGGGAGGCEPCSALHLCVVSCHPAGTPLDYCQACDGTGGAK